MKNLPLVTIGRHHTVKELHRDLLHAVKFGTWATELIERVVLTPIPAKVQLVTAHISHDLNLDDSCQYEDIVAAGAKNNMHLCTMEMAYEARLDYLDQPVDEFLVVAMEPELIKPAETTGTQTKPEMVLLTLEHLSNMGPQPWIRAHSKIINDCWNPFHDPCFREVVFRID